MSATFRHQALLYRDAGEFLAGTVRFVEDGLAAKEPVLVAVPGGNLDLIAGALRNSADRVRFADMTEAGRNPGRIIPWVLHAFITEHTGTRVRIIGEPTWAGRSDVEYPACVQHDALINRAFAGWDASILCPYDLATLPASAVSDAERTHPELVGGLPAGSGPWAAAGTSARYRPEEVVEEFNLPLPPVPDSATRLDFDRGRLGMVRQFVIGFAGEAGLGERRAVDLQLAVNELTTNSVAHGGGRGTLAMWSESGPAAGSGWLRPAAGSGWLGPAAGSGRLGPGVVVAEVRDRGRAERPLSGRVPPAADHLGGRGLVLVNYVSDLVRVHTSPAGTTVRVYLAY